MNKGLEANADLLASQQDQCSGKPSSEPVVFISASGTEVAFATLRDAGSFLRSAGITDPSAI